MGQCIVGEIKPTMKILTAEQLRTVDRRSGDTLALMESAGARVVDAIE